ncbi:hypothetical protein CRYUN_Cryun09bG0035600 [Craigia yunnanensis]
MFMDAKREKIQEVGMSKGIHVSVLQAFAPAIEAMKGGSSDELDGEKTLLPEKRPAVHFKFRTGKKILGELLDLSLQKKGERSTTFLLRDEERNDKKRRSEFFLRQSTEYPMELN